jgi:hypothetical protein
MATKNTQYVIRVGEQNRAGDGHSYLSGLDRAGLDRAGTYPYLFSSKRRLAIRFTGRKTAEAAALDLYRLMTERGYNSAPVRLVPATGGAETGFRPERAS